MNHFFLYSLQGSALIPGFDTIIDLSQNLKTVSNHTTQKV